MALAALVPPGVTKVVVTTASTEKPETVITFEKSTTLLFAVPSPTMLVLVVNEKVAFAASTTNAARAGVVTKRS